MIDRPTRRRYASVLLERLDDDAYTLHPRDDGSVRILPDPPAELADEMLTVRRELRALIRSRDRTAETLVKAAEEAGLGLWWDPDADEVQVGWSRIPSEDELPASQFRALLELLEDNKRAIGNVLRRTGRIGRPEELLGDPPDGEGG